MALFPVMENLLETVVGIVGLGCELATVLVVALGAGEALVRLALGWRQISGKGLKKVVWVRFASWILLALEFALAADIVRTAIAPSWDDIGQLAAIAGIRTFLNYFLEKDVESFEQESAAKAETRGELGA